jgi:hypothetical protein
MKPETSNAETEQRRQPPKAVRCSDGVSQPVRVQLSRKKGWKMPPNTVKVDRTTRWGNPHYIGFCGVCGVDHTRKESVAEFEAMLMENLWATRSLLEPLRGKNLACWCKIGEPCHADILLRLANDGTHAQRKENP